MESKNIYEKNIKAAVDFFIALLMVEGRLAVKEYFSIKKLGIELDWVIVLTMDHNGFIAIPTVAEYRFGSNSGWYDYTGQCLDNWTNIIMFKPIEIRNVDAADTIRTKLFNEYKEKEGIKSNSDFKNAFNKFLIKYCKN